MDIVYSNVRRVKMETKAETNLKVFYEKLRVAA